MRGIACFGDSLTFGVGESPKIGWVGRLKNHYESQDFFNGVFNFGIPGHTSTDLLKRFEAECDGLVAIKRPEDYFLILICIGGNDCKWDGMPEENRPVATEVVFKQNIRELIKKAKKYPAKLAFLGLPPVDETRTLPYEETSYKNDRTQLFNDITKECCRDEGVPFLDVNTLMRAEAYQKLLVDGMHPNKEGYDFMYEKILEFLTKNNLL